VYITDGSGQLRDSASAIQALEGAPHS
jgi:hypothetical protein